MKEASRQVLIGLSCAIAGSVATVLLTPLVGKYLPTTQRIDVEPGARIEVQQAKPPFHIPQLRTNLPPFVYSVGEAGMRRRSDPIFGLARNPAWFYEIRIANLTTRSVGPIEITILAPDTNCDLYVLPRQSLRRADGEQLDPDDPFPAQWTPDGKKATVRIDRLASGHSGILQYAVIAGTNPGLKYGQLSIACPEGTFENITPVQWDSIGWRAGLPPK